MSQLATPTTGQPPARPETALTEGFARWQNELLGTLVCLVGNRDDALDALQDAFLKCWKHREEVPGIQNLKAWIFRITLNTGRDLRTSAWRRKRESLVEDGRECPGRECGPAATAERSEQMERLAGAIKELRAEEQEVFLLRQNGQLTYEEIGEALDLPVGTVKTRMRLALGRLREAFAEEAARRLKPR